MIFPEKSTQQDGSRTWLTGVWDGEAGIGWDASQRALAAAIQHVTGRPVDFDEVLVRSGDAFAAAFSDVYQGLTYLAGPIDVMTTTALSYGFRGGWRFPATFDEAAALVRSEIEAGRPVPAGGAAQPYGCPPWGLIVGYDDNAPSFCFAGYGYRGGTRWMDVRGDCGREETGPWNGRVRGLLPTAGRFWFTRALFLLGEPGPEPDPEELRLAALKLAAVALRAEPVRVRYWGGVTYSMGVHALASLAQSLDTLDAAAITDAPQPDGAYDWYQIGTVLADCSDMVMRGRRAAARVFRRWGQEDGRLATLREAPELLEQAAELAELVWSGVSPLWPWEEGPRRWEDPEWCRAAAESFRSIVAYDRECLRIIEGVLGEA